MICTLYLEGLLINKWYETYIMTLLKQSDYTNDYGQAHHPMMRRAIAFLAFLLCAFCIWGISPALAEDDPAASPLANVARIGGDSERTRFVVDLSRVVKYKAFVLKSPNRVVIDLPKVKFLFPAGQGKEKKGLIQAYRYGLIGDGRSRIVIDIKKPVKINKTFIKKPEFGQPARLVLELMPLESSSKKASKGDKLKKDTPRQKLASNSFLPSAKPQNSGSKPAEKRVASIAPLIRPPHSGRKVIIIDAGHGGEDAGARSRKGTKEKNIVLSFAQSLKAHLEKTGKYQVYMTRDSDVFISLRNRVLFAIEKKAGLFISIHADSVPGSWRRRKRVRGATIYTLSKDGASELDRLIAEEQNKTPVMDKIAFPKGFREILNNANQTGEIPHIIKELTELTQRETNSYSVAFANKFLIKKLKKATRMNRQPIRGADFHVLRNAEIPSVLLEIGFLSNNHDTANLRSKKWRKRVSLAVSQAIDSYMMTSQSRRPY